MVYIHVRKIWWTIRSHEQSAMAMIHRPNDIHPGPCLLSSILLHASHPVNSNPFCKVRWRWIQKNGLPGCSLKRFSIMGAKSLRGGKKRQLDAQCHVGTSQVHRLLPACCFNVRRPFCPPQPGQIFHPSATSFPTQAPSKSPAAQ